MISGQALALALAAALTWYLGHETVKGVKWVASHVKAGIHKIVHQHDAKEVARRVGRPESRPCAS